MQVLYYLYNTLSNTGLSSVSAPLAEFREGK